MLSQDPTFFLPHSCTTAHATPEENKQETLRVMELVSGQNGFSLGQYLHDSCAADSSHYILVFISLTLHWNVSPDINFSVH